MTQAQTKQVRLRHRSRTMQVPIYLGKLLRSFIYQNDWKVLPMAAVIAAMLAMVIRKDCFVTMEGTLKGAFGLTCVAIWNGCFNSIQSICRERAIVKREHRSGMHITSYVFSHMVYQALLCLGQTGLMLYVFKLMGIHYPPLGLFSRYFAVDLFITLFLITYASDMISLLVSSIAHTTTTAMTVMPFLLIFQLVFSGGIFSLPAWTAPFSSVTLSNYGIKCISAQADYNSLPMVSAWTSLENMSNDSITVTVTGEQLVKMLQDEELPYVGQLRQAQVMPELTAGQLIDMLAASPELQPALQEPRDITFKLADAFSFVGKEKIKDFVEAKTGQAMAKDAYYHSRGNVLAYWMIISAIGLAFALASVIVLEFIDKDKR
ncbi:MAG: ABC transporter permease [Clostridia bacterium]|nr:ABC transporter permease [Clostridia bacterium]